MNCQICGQPMVVEAIIEPGEMCSLANSELEGYERILALKRYTKHLVCPKCGWKHSERIFDP